MLSWFPGPLSHPGTARPGPLQRSRERSYNFEFYLSGVLLPLDVARILFKPYADIPHSESKLHNVSRGSSSRLPLFLQEPAAQVIAKI